MGGERGAFFLGQRYPKAGKRGQLLSKWGTVRRQVEEVLWRTSGLECETSVTLEELSETSDDKEDVDVRVTRKSRLGRNDCVAPRLSTASEDRP